MDGTHEESMHFYLQAIEESEIRQHWELQRNDEDDYKRRLAGTEVTITFAHMKRVFKLLLIGYGAATLAFLVELIMGCVKKWKSD
jgi:hypothetical protein